MARPPQVLGRGPTPRSYHSAVPIRGGAAMVVFGGNDGERCFDEVFVLTLAAADRAAAAEGAAPGGGGSSGGGGGGSGLRWEWSRPIVVGRGPRPRTGHAACALRGGRAVLVHGGWDPQCNGDKAAYFRDAFELDTEAWEWKPAKAAAGALAAAGGLTGHTMDLVPAGQPPGPKAQRVAVFGGQREGGERTRAVAITDLP